MMKEYWKTTKLKRGQKTKAKGKCWLEKITGNAEECSKIKEKFRRKRDVWTRREKLDEELNLAQRMLDQATTSLTEAIGKGDMVGVRVASELVNSSRKKVDETVLMRKQHVKEKYLEW